MFNLEFDKEYWQKSKEDGYWHLIVDTQSICRQYVFDQNERVGPYHLLPLCMECAKLRYDI